MNSALRIVTRGSRLARAQTELVTGWLRAAHPEIDFRIQSVSTKGDRVTNVPLSSFRGTGVFVKELERVLENDEADIAVHSLKDVPVTQPENLVLASFPERGDPGDVLLSPENSTLESLGSQAVVGTDSPRRIAQLKYHRPDLGFKALRGNIDTRIAKMMDGQYDAIVLAAAGLQRIGKEIAPGTKLPLNVCLPAAGQGILVLECRRDDRRSQAVARSIDHLQTRVAAEAERIVLSTIGQGCSLPLAVYANPHDHDMILQAMFGDASAPRIVRHQVTAPSGHHKEAAVELGRIIVDQCEKRGITIQ